MSKLARRSKRRLRRFSGASDVRGYGGLDGGFPIVPVAIGLGLLALAFNKGTVMAAASSAFDFAKVIAFRTVLPPAVGQYAEHILKAAQQYGVDPWALAAIMYNESRGGVATGYRPQGPTGTGDFTPRGPKGVSLPPGWQASGYAKYANPATGLPPDGKGWGRGLMQIDYGAHNAWVISNNWADAQTNINKAAELYRANQSFFARAPGGAIAIEQWRVTTGMPGPGYNIQPWATKYGRAFPTSAPDPRPLSGQQLMDATIASYNAGTSGPLQAIAVGLPAEAVTANQNYVSKFLALVPGWKIAYEKIVG
ncbi:MAG: hypothetical protein WAV09_03290 [Minisyncoccia bacterium]